MRAAAIPGYLRDTLLRMLPHRAPRGLRRVGHPTRQSPVLLTGNFTLTVRRVEEALERAGIDAWLLVADSKGINVWCAAGGGHLTHHEVISSLRTSRVADEVDHRVVILPQLGATGIERREVERVTGWTVKWGPAHLEDLPDYLARGGRLRAAHRDVRFPLRDRLEMSLMWGAPLVALSALVLGLVCGWPAGLAASGALALAVGALFVVSPYVPLTGARSVATFAAFAALAAALPFGALALFGALGPAQLVATAIAWALVTTLLILDVTGSTPLYPGGINTIGNFAKIELVTERCTGAADCVRVCPRGVLKMDGHARKVTIAQRERCIQCGACVVQCPEDALRFRYGEDRVVEPAVIRRTRMNMLGRRAIHIDKGTNA